MVVVHRETVTGDINSVTDFSDLTTPPVDQPSMTVLIDRCVFSVRIQLLKLQSPKMRLTHDECFYREIPLPLQQL